MSDPSSTAADWVTIWQSELAALACDREAAEHIHAVAAAIMAMTGGLAGGDRGAALSGADAPSGPKAASAASDAGAQVERLERRVAELERQLAGR